MTKAVLHSLGILLLLTTVLPAQNNSATDMAINRAVMDQANTILLRQKLEDAKNAAARGDLLGAAKLYEDAKQLVDEIGSGIDAETAQTISGLVETRLELARQAQHRGDYLTADEQVTRALRVDPHNAAALEFKKENDQTMAALKGHIPDNATLEQIPAIVNDKTQAGTLVQDGRVLYEAGKFEEAETKLNQALKLDPDNRGAFYYLNLVNQANYGREEHNRTTQAQNNMVQVAKAWSPKVGIGLPVPNSYVTNTDIHTGVGREVIYRKLNNLRLDTISWPDGLPLSEVIRYLIDQSKARDPDKKGINFIFNPNVESASAAGGPGAGPGVPGPLNANTGLPEAPAASGGAPESVDASTINVKLALTDVSIHDALDAVVMVADRPIKYSVEDYAVVISAKPSGPEPPILEMRVFKVDPNTFYEGLQNVSTINFGSANSSSSGGGGGGNSGGGGGGNSGGGGGGNSGGNSSGSGSGSGGASVPVVLVTGSSSGGGGAGGGTGGGAGGGGRAGGGGGAGGGGAGGGGGATASSGVGGLSYINSPSSQMQNVSQVAQAFFSAIGVNLTATAPGRSIAFNDRLGLLFVRATPGELDTIERAIQALNQVAPQVHIKTRFIEVGQDDSSALGFDWYLGNFINGKVVASGGSQNSMNTAGVTAANPTGVFPGNLANGANPSTIIAQSASDQLLTGGLRNTGPALATVTGILTDPNFRVVLHALEQRTVVETLAEPEAVTTSGRQTQMRATDIQFILTGFSFLSGGAGAPATATTAAGNPGTSAITPTTQQFEIGPTLDVVPYVLSDGYTVNLTLIPQVLQFLQYDTVPAVPGYNPGTTASTSGGGTTTLPTVLPHFTVREIVTTVNIWDNQTVVLGGLISSSINSTKDKVPFLGDLPLFGRLFQSQSKTTSKKNLMIFVTATIVDPAGNRVHSDDELPFNQYAIPEQPAVEGQTFQPNPAAANATPPPPAQ